MADKRMNIVVGAKDEASKKLDGIRGSFHQIGLTAIEVNQALELAKKGIEAFQDAYEFGKLGAETEKMEFAFERMSRSVGADSGNLLMKIRQLTDGTVSDFQIMQQAAKAATLGIPIDKVGEFAEIARAAAAAMGESTEFMFDSIVTGTARQSKLILDNLGIIINQEEIYRKETERLGHTLSEAEKRQAFINSVLESGQKIIGDIGDVSGLAINKYDQFEASMENLRRAGAKLAEKALTPIVGVLGSMAENLLNAITYQKSLTEAVRDGEVAFNDMGGAIEYADRSLADYLRSQEYQKEAQEEQAAASWEQIDADSLVAAGLNKLAESYGKVTAEATMTADTVNNVLIPTVEKQNKILIDIQENRLDEYIVMDNDYVDDHIAIMEDAGEDEKDLVDDVMTFREDRYQANLNYLKKMFGFYHLEATANSITMVNIAAGTTDLIMRTHQALADDIVEQMWGAKANFREIFKQMAKDFIKLFIAEVTKEIAIAVAKWAVMLLIFDKRENDLMAMQMGRDYAHFFQAGVFEGLNSGRLARTMATSITPQIPMMTGGSTGSIQAGSQIVIQIQGNVIGEEEWLRKNLIPALEEKIRTKEANFSR